MGLQSAINSTSRYGNVTKFCTIVNINVKIDPRNFRLKSDLLSELFLDTGQVSSVFGKWN